MHHVFVDFENIQDIDLGALGDEPVEVTVMLGKDQKPPPTRLLAALVERTGGVRLVKLNWAGRNALDMSLAYHVGAAATRDPEGTFHILSEDKDYDPLIAHLQHIGIQAVRVEKTAPATPPEPEPPLARAPRRAPAPERRPAAPPPPKPAPPPSRSTPAATDRVAAVIQWLERNAKNRPTRHARLLRQINDQFGRRLAEGEADEIAAELLARGLVAIDTQNRVTYPGFASTR
jgi:PIN domain